MLLSNRILPAALTLAQAGRSCTPQTAARGSTWAGRAKQLPQDELARLLKRAEQGDRSVLPKLREALNADANLWQHYGDLAAQAEAALILLAAGKNLLLPPKTAGK